MSMTSARSAPRSVKSGFWTGRILPRLVAIVVAVYATFNMSGYSVYHGIETLFMQASSVGSATQWILLALVAITVLGLWAYIIRKAWQGAGAGWVKFLIVPVLLGLLLALGVTTGLLDPQGVVFISLIQLAVALALGLMFCMTLIDRHLSGTTTGTVIVQEDDTHPAEHDHGN